DGDGLTLHLPEVAEQFAVEGSHGGVPYLVAGGHFSLDGMLVIRPLEMEIAWSALGTVSGRWPGGGPLRGFGGRFLCRIAVQNAHPPRAELRRILAFLHRITKDTVLSARPCRSAGCAVRIGFIHFIHFIQGTHPF